MEARVVLLSLKQTVGNFGVFWKTLWDYVTCFGHYLLCRVCVCVCVAAKTPLLPCKVAYSESGDQSRSCRLIHITGAFPLITEHSLLWLPGTSQLLQSHQLRPPNWPLRKTQHWLIFSSDLTLFRMLEFDFPRRWMILENQHVRDIEVVIFSAKWNKRHSRIT